MRINVADLKRYPDQSLDFSVTEEMAPLALVGEKVIFIGPVLMEGRVTSSRELLILEGKVQAVVQRECNRCLAPFEEKVVAPIEEEYALSPHTRVADDRLKDEARPLEGEEIDLYEVAVESIILNLAMKAVCRPECLGLCPHCGHDLNQGPCDCSKTGEDERLAVLRTLLADSLDH